MIKAWNLHNRSGPHFLCFFFFFFFFCRSPFEKAYDDVRTGRIDRAWGAQASAAKCISVPMPALPGSFSGGAPLEFRQSVLLCHPRRDSCTHCLFVLRVSFSSFGPCVRVVFFVSVDATNLKDYTFTLFYSRLRLTAWYICISHLHLNLNDIPFEWEVDCFQSIWMFQKKRRNNKPNTNDVMKSGGTEKSLLFFLLCLFMSRHALLREQVSSFLFVHEKKSLLTT